MPVVGSSAYNTAGQITSLVRALLKLNLLTSNQRFVEVVIMSRNSSETSMRIFNSIRHYGLDITRAALSGGASLAPEPRAFRSDIGR